MPLRSHVFVVPFLLAACNPAIPGPTIQSEVVPEFAALQAEVEPQFVQVDFSGAVELQVDNGRPVDRAQFPAVLRTITGKSCTAALIGPATLLLAAHCVRQGQAVSFGSSGASVRGICQRAPGYNSETHEQDWALCLLQKKVVGITYESVDLKTLPALGKKLALTGYGCTVESGAADGILRLGWAKVADRPPGLQPERAALYTKANLANGEAVLCGGDSGGPLFNTGDDLSSSRTIVGVNSRTLYQYGVSIFAALASAEGAAFIKDFAAQHKQEICGHNKSIGCK